MLCRALSKTKIKHVNETDYSEEVTWIHIASKDKIKICQLKNVKCSTEHGLTGVADVTCTRWLYDDCHTFPPLGSTGYWQIQPDQSQIWRVLIQLFIRTGEVNGKGHTLSWCNQLLQNDPTYGLAQCHLLHSKWEGNQYSNWQVSKMDIVRFFFLPPTANYIFRITTMINKHLLFKNKVY